VSDTLGARLRERPRREVFSPCRGVNVPIGLMMLLAFTVAPQSRPDFSGLWRLILERSTFSGQAPKELLRPINAFRCSSV